LTASHLPSTAWTKHLASNSHQRYHTQPQGLSPILPLLRLIVSRQRGFVRCAPPSSSPRYVSSRGTQKLHVAGQGRGHYFDFDRQQSHASPEEAQTRRRIALGTHARSSLDPSSASSQMTQTTYPGPLSHLQGSVHICPSRCLAFIWKMIPFSCLARPLNFHSP
jgi:hypothetical protein